jgi:hypothetical protein
MLALANPDPRNSCPEKSRPFKAPWLNDKGLAQAGAELLKPIAIANKNTQIHVHTKLLINMG